MAVPSCLGKDQNAATCLCEWQGAVLQPHQQLAYFPKKAICHPKVCVRATSAQLHEHKLTAGQIAFTDLPQLRPIHPVLFRWFHERFLVLQ